MIGDKFVCNAEIIINAIEKRITQEQLDIFENATGTHLYKWVDTISNAVVFKGIEFSDYLSSQDGRIMNTCQRVAELGEDFDKLFREVLTSRPMFAIAIID